MRRLGWVVVVAVCGCDNVFQLTHATAPPADAAPDALDAYVPDHHDEDHDTVEDIDDNCPADPNPLQEDGDGDKVGDACDPHPNLPIDRIRYFDSLRTFPTSKWNVPGTGPWVQIDDAVTQPYDTDNQLAVVNLGGPLTDASIEVIVASNSTSTAVNNAAGAYLVTGGFGPEPDGVICYFYERSNQLEIYPLGQGPGILYADSTLPGSGYPGRLLLQSSTDQAGAPSGPPLCAGARDGYASTTVALAGATAPVGTALVGMYTYYATATFTSITVFDRIP